MKFKSIVKTVVGVVAITPIFIGLSLTCKAIEYGFIKVEKVSL